MTLGSREASLANSRNRSRRAGRSQAAHSPLLETMNFPSHVGNSHPATLDMDADQVKEIYGQLKHKSSQLNTLLD